MINKRSLWFLTLFSLILILSIYYITMPTQILENNKDNDKDKYNINDCFYLFGVVLILGIAFNSLILFRSKDIWLCVYVFLISFICFL